MSDKPAILQDSEFTIEEGFAYKGLRTGAIWSNKLFFSCLFLLMVWLLMSMVTGVEGCAEGIRTETLPNGSIVDAGTEDTCSAFLTPTAKYLGAMGIFSFLASIGFGLLGLVVGKNILEVTRTADEAGSEESAEGDVAGSAEPRPEASEEH